MTFSIPITPRHQILALAFCLLAPVPYGLAVAESVSTTPIGADITPAANMEGIQFHCREDRLRQLESEMEAYLHELDIPASLFVVQHNKKLETLTYTLATPKDDFNTLDFVERPAFDLHDANVLLPQKNGDMRSVATVSQKEIVLAMLQRGRLTEFAGTSCHIAALIDHVGIRQNTVAWAERLEFRWPNGGRAHWNPRYWHLGTPRPGVPLHTAMADMFLNQSRYQIGCYTATKMVMIQGVLDYYARVKKDPNMLKLIETQLLVDGEPLVDVEPGRIWNFEADFDARKQVRQGKLLSAQFDVMPKNFVPGDWSYILNPDPRSASKTGYEGSNAIYLGRNKFDDYYNDNRHAYSYWQKLDEVYQWRNQVFSRRRDGARIQPLTVQQLDQLGLPPKDGGLVLDWRVGHQFFDDGERQTTTRD